MSNSRSKSPMIHSRLPQCVHLDPIFKGFASFSEYNIFLPVRFENENRPYSLRKVLRNGSSFYLLSYDRFDVGIFEIQQIGPYIADFFPLGYIPERLKVQYGQNKYTFYQFLLDLDYEAHTFFFNYDVFFLMV